jgi:hypothetical protein
MQPSKKTNNLRWLGWEFTLATWIACLGSRSCAYYFAIYHPINFIWSPIKCILVESLINVSTSYWMNATIDCIFYSFSPKVIAPKRLFFQKGVIENLFCYSTYCTCRESPPRISKSISSPPSAIKMKAVTAPPVPADRMVADTLPYLM